MQDNNSSATQPTNDVQINIASSSHQVESQSARVQKNRKRIATYDKALAVLNVANTALMLSNAVSSMIVASDDKEPLEGLSGKQIGVQVVNLVGSAIPLLTTITANIIEKDSKRRQLYNKATDLRLDDDITAFDEQKETRVKNWNKGLIGTSAILTALSYASRLTYIGLEVSSIVYKAEGNYKYASTLDYTIGGMLFLM